jgi:hypothetical protein
MLLHWNINRSGKSYVDNFQEHCFYIRTCKAFYLHLIMISIAIKH